MIELKGLDKQYHGRTVLKNLNLKIDQGDFCILLGASGSGKSTSLKCINGLVTPDAGEVFVRGRSIKEVEAVKLRRSIGYAFQNIGLFPHYSVAKNCSIVPELLGWDKKKISDRVQELLQLFSLDPEVYASKYPHQLSGGEAQRVGVARALASDPDILLLDEPFGAVDPPTRKKLQQEFLEIQNKLKKTIVFVTHDIEEALILGNRIVVMHDGKIVQNDTPMNLVKNPSSSYVREFLGENIGLKKLSLLKVKDFTSPLEFGMKSPKQEISEDANLVEALNQMLEEGCSHLRVLPISTKPNSEKIITLNRLMEI